MFFHGVKASEISTDIISTIETTAGLPVIVGTAPVNLTENPLSNVNKPVLCNSFDEFVAAFGYSDNWDKYTLCEAAYSEFILYGVKPAVFINVLDPASHKMTISGSMYNVTNDLVEIDNDALLNSFIVKENSYSTVAAIKNTDYTLAFDTEGKAIISIVSGGSLDGKTSIYISYDRLNPSAVTYQDVIGGVNTNGETKGLELVNTIYTMFGMIPGIIAAPSWSENPTVATVMKAKASTLSSLFKCICLTDVDTSQVRNYRNVYTWKNSNNYTGANQIVCWPCVRNGEQIYHMSTHLMGVIGAMDADNDDIPYMSPSNHTLQATGLCLKDGTEILLSLDQANILNSQGIVTGLNFSGGFKIWGNYTAIYPSLSDPKDIFICCRRMLDWQQKTLILNYWQRVDAPLIPRVIRSIVDSESIRLNGLVARGYLIAAEIQFNEDENPTTDLLAGKVKLHTKLTCPVPAEEIEEIVEYDASAYSLLFE